MGAVIPRVKPVLHYITHTEDSRKPDCFERVTSEHVQTDEIPASYPEISLVSHRARCRGNHHQFPTPASPAAAQRGSPAEEGRARAGPAPPEARGGSAPSREAIPFPSPRAEHPGAARCRTRRGQPRAPARADV